VLFVAFPDVGLLDLTGAQTVFWAATKAMEARGLKGYERLKASLKGGLVRSAEGLELQTMRLSEVRPSSVDTLVVPGSPHMASARRLLEDSARNVDQIAMQCGFGDEERMRVTFQRHLGVAPRDSRKRFARRGLHEAAA
jgi:transcriptional regulator GlxA family with amidase domain